jgi:uncharacterized protein (TIGR02145 family)
MIPIINGLFSGLRGGFQGMHKRLENFLAYFGMYLSRVNSDGGTISDQNISREYFRMCEQNGISRSILLAIIAGSGAKFRTSGIYSYFSKLYSMFGLNDAVQATDLNQPYLAGNIAPNERLAMLNPNGGARYVAHPSISFGASDPWSVTAIINNNEIISGNRFSYGADAYSQIRFSSKRITIFNASGSFVDSSNLFNYIVGKTSIITITAPGNGSILIYLNGIYIETLSLASNLSFAQINNPSAPVNGRYYGYIIRNIALTQSQEASQYKYFRSIYPEIPSVVIGTQEWATSNLDVVCTPQGNVIPEITDNANVEKVTNGGWEVDLAGWNTHSASTNTKESGTRTGGSGSYVMRTATTAASSGAKTACLKTGAWYKVNGWVRSDGVGVPKVWIGGGSPNWTGTNSTTWQNFSFFAKAYDANLYLTSGNANASYLDWDDLFVQLVGWSGLTEVYDAVYAATSGSAAVKDQAGCLAAAAWCHYNNDSANGAIYGKLYNWYAARTMQYDIDAYNSANPSTPWGWKVPLQADFTTLQTTLGGSTVAGGKMKKEGLSYWLTPNTEANNSSGFTAIGGCYRLDIDGVFTAAKSSAYFWTLDLYAFVCAYNSTALSSANWAAVKMRGTSLRLIKA